MNTKVLASLGVIVALLTAWLFAALYTASSVSVEPAAVAEPQARSTAPSRGYESSGLVQTSVTIANQDVKTSVRVAE